MGLRFTTAHDQQLSLWQSAVHEVSQRIMAADAFQGRAMRESANFHIRASQGGTPPTSHLATATATGPDEATAAASQLQLSRAYFALAEATRVGNKSALGAASAFLRDFSDYDPGWIECVLAYLCYYPFQSGPKYNDWQVAGGGDLQYGVIPYRLPDNAKVLVLSDWGTGMTDAVAMFRQALATFRPDAILHLGDVYYAGLDTECEDHVLNVLATVFEALKIPPIPCFTIPGNHEYYSGGGGFYEMISRLNSQPALASCQQAASYFQLQTQDGRWQFLGMDTGINDHNAVTDDLIAIQLDKNATGPGLMPSEVDWHYDKLASFNGSTILLSHHQLFSANSAINGSATGQPPYRNESLYATFEPYLGQVSAWFWGHEHNWVAFQNGLFGLKMGRLVGCSAYEEGGNDDPYAINYPEVPYIPAMPQVQLSPYPTNGTSYYQHAVALIDFNRAQPTDPITVSYYQFPSWDQDTTPPDPLPPLVMVYSEPIAPAPRNPPGGS